MSPRNCLAICEQCIVKPPGKQQTLLAHTAQVPHLTATLPAAALLSTQLHLGPRPPAQSQTRPAACQALPTPQRAPSVQQRATAPATSLLRHMLSQVRRPPLPQAGPAIPALSGKHAPTCRRLSPSSVMWSTQASIALVPCLMLLVTHQSHLHQPWRLDRWISLTQLHWPILYLPG